MMLSNATSTRITCLRHYHQSCMQLGRLRLRLPDIATAKVASSRNRYLKLSRSINSASHLKELTVSADSTPSTVELTYECVKPQDDSKSKLSPIVILPGLLCVHYFTSF